MAMTAAERLPCSSWPGQAASTLQNAATRAAGLPLTGGPNGHIIPRATQGRQKKKPVVSCWRAGPLVCRACSKDRRPQRVQHMGAAGGEIRRAGVVAQASGKGGGQGAPAKMALVGKKLQLKPPVPRPEQKEATEQGGRGGSGAHAEEETQRKEKEAAAKASPVQSKETRGVQDGPPSQQAEVGDRSDTAEGARIESAEEGKAGPSAGAGGRALSAEEQAAEIQALRKVLQGAPGGEPARNSGALYAGVLEEIGLINWPPLGQVAGTTTLVMGMLVGAAAVLTAFNYGLSEGTKAFFEDGPVRDAIRSSLHL